VELPDHPILESAVFRIKICGVTVALDAELAAEAGADAVGLNFYAPSPRCVTPAQAREIVCHLPPEVARVGVFVNATADELRRLIDEGTVNVLQLHGDESPGLLAQLPGCQIIKAFRCRDSRLEEDVACFVESARQLGCPPAAVLLDAARPGRYGGTGRTADWSQATGLVAQLGGLPLVLAGGLSPDNVAEAIRTVRPAAVDTASGVETCPGRKDPERIRQFVRRALEAFAGTEAGLPRA
jgi:phosphoribosylanthranilate isomerase